MVALFGMGFRRNSSSYIMPINPRFYDQGACFVHDNLYLIPLKSFFLNVQNSSPFPAILEELLAFPIRLQRSDNFVDQPVFFGL